MDEKLPADDIRVVTRLLSKAALARIKAAETEATAELLAALSGYWESIRLSTAFLREHDPSELIPFFEKYAEQRTDSIAKELLPHFTDSYEFIVRLSINVIGSISLEIRPKRGLILKDCRSGESSELVRALKEFEPNRREEWRKELSEPSGVWEICLSQSFERHMLKFWGRMRRRDDKTSDEVQLLRQVFLFKYRLFLRLFPNSSD